MDDEICTIFYHLHFQKWEGMTSMMLRKGFLRTRRHFQCSLSFHLSVSSDCYFSQNKIFLQLFDKCFSLVRSGNALQNLALWKDRTPFHTTPSKNMREKYFFFLSFIFSFSGNAALYGKCILSYHLLPILANCIAPPALQFVIPRRKARFAKVFATRFRIRTWFCFLFSHFFGQIVNPIIFLRRTYFY